MSGPVLDFLAAMEAAGITPREPIAAALTSGQIVRFECEGDGKGRKNGWAVLRLDGTPSGAFGNYKLGISERWRSRTTERLRPVERRRLGQQYRQQRVEREAALLDSQRDGAERCNAEWQSAGPVNPRHPYLMRKNIPGEGLRQSRDRLLVPMRDVTGAIWNVQRIAPDGTKRFAKGARQAGLFFLVGEHHGTVCIAEGYATAAAVRKATGHAIAVAFSAKNLTSTALAVRAAFPGSEIVVCADDDRHLAANPRVGRNLGIEAAEDAARAVGGRVALPPREDAA